MLFLPGTFVQTGVKGQFGRILLGPDRVRLSHGGSAYLYETQDGAVIACSQAEAEGGRMRAPGPAAGVPPGWARNGDGTATPPPLMFLRG